MLNANDYVQRAEKGYQLKRTLIVKIDVSNVFYNGKYLSISDDELSVFLGFIWDGATGVHDGKKDKNGIPINWLETCVHDAMCAEREFFLSRFPLSNYKIDQIFRTLLRNNNRWYRNIWYHIVRLFSRFLRK